MILSHTLFSMCVKKVIKNCLYSQRAVKIGGRRIECIHFSDDVSVLAETKTELNEMFNDLYNL